MTPSESSWLNGESVPDPEHDPQEGVFAPDSKQRPVDPVVAVVIAPVVGAAYKTAFVPA